MIVKKLSWNKFSNGSNGREVANLELNTVPLSWLFAEFKDKMTFESSDTVWRIIQR